MRCGATCFIVEIVGNGEKTVKEVTARTPAEARKIIRREYGRETNVLKVKQK